MQFIPHRVRNVPSPFVVDKVVVNELSTLEFLNCLGPPVGFPCLIGRPGHRRKALDARSIMSSVTQVSTELWGPSRAGTRGPMFFPDSPL